MSIPQQPNFLEEMRSATFCGVFPGNGWGHIETPIMLGCIPVVVQVPLLLPLAFLLLVVVPLLAAVAAVMWWWWCARGPCGDQTISC